MKFLTSVVAGLAAAGGVAGSPKSNTYDPKDKNHKSYAHVKPIKSIQMDPRPYYLINDMNEGPLKRKLESCSEMKWKANDFSVSHRGGGTLQFPEHTLESSLAGARMGAGVLECDVAFTKDRQLVCRHSHCDLHTTTQIVNIPELNKKCTQPFQPAKDGKPASAKCCTSDITLSEFKTLCGKMDSFNASATNPKDFLGGTPAWRTELYNQCGTLLTHKEYISLTDALGLKFTPELKFPDVKMPFQGSYSQQDYAQQLIDEYKAAGIKPSRVFPQSFNYPDILYWLKREPKFGKQAVYLDETGDSVETFPGAVQNLTRYAKDGVRIVAPPLPYLVKVEKGKIVPSEYAVKAKKLGLDIITWSLERSPPIRIAAANKDYYYSTIVSALKRDGDLYTLVDVLYRQVGVKGIFSDWSSTVSYYANCFNIKVKW